MKKYILKKWYPSLYEDIEEGIEVEYSHIGRVLLSNPPQRQINCTKCSHVGYLTIERAGYK